MTVSMVDLLSSRSFPDGRVPVCLDPRWVESSSGCGGFVDRLGDVRKGAWTSPPGYVDGEGTYVIMCLLVEGM